MVAGAMVVGDGEGVKRDGESRAEEGGLTTGIANRVSSLVAPPQGCDCSSAILTRHHNADR